MATLAYRAKLDAFERVKKMIKSTVAALLPEKGDETKHKDFRADEFDSNQLQPEKKQRQSNDLTAQIADLDSIVKPSATAIEALKSAIAELKVQLKHASEDYVKQNKEFQLNMTDQRQTQKLLKTALVVLQDFYGSFRPPSWTRPSISVTLTMSPKWTISKDALGPSSRTSSRRSTTLRLLTGRA